MKVKNSIYSQTAKRDGRKIGTGGRLNCIGSQGAVSCLVGCSTFCLAQKGHDQKSRDCHSNTDPTRIRLDLKHQRRHRCEHNEAGEEK